MNGINVGAGMRNISAYVQQHELFISNMTVKETLVFRVSTALYNGSNNGKCVNGSLTRI